MCFIVAICGLNVVASKKAAAQLEDRWASTLGSTCSSTAFFYFTAVLWLETNHSRNVGLLQKHPFRFILT